MPAPATRNPSFLLALCLCACGGSQTGDTAPLGPDETVHSWKKPVDKFWERGDQGCPDGSILERGEENGNKTATCKKGGVAHGARAVWHQNGQLAVLGLLRDGEPEGLWREWRANGQLSVEVEFSDGLREGKFVQHLENGARLEENYKLGKRSGKAHAYAPDGKLLREASYENDKLNGVQLEFHPSQKKRIEVMYKDGLPHGDVIRYNPEGDEIGRFKVENGTGTWKEWYDHGQLGSETGVVKGTPHGAHVRYHENGRIQVEGNYKDGAEIGEWKAFDPSGQLLLTTEYDSGRPLKTTSYEGGKISRVETFHKTGGRKALTPYSLGARHGTAVVWRENGLRSEQGEYEKNNKHGEWAYFDDAGEVTRTELFKRGKRTRKTKGGDNPPPPRGNGLETGVEMCDRYIRRYLSCPTVPEAVRASFVQGFQEWKQQNATGDGVAARQLEQACQKAGSDWEKGLAQLKC